MDTYWTIYLMNNTTTNYPLWLAIMLVIILGASIIGLIALVVWAIKEIWIK